MRAAWRLVRLLTTTMAYTAGVALWSRMLPHRERIRFRARHQSRGSSILCRIFGIEVRVRGARVPDRPLLVVCNHFGILDPFILASVLQVAFVGKAEIRKWPLFGWVAQVFAVIFVYRDKTHTVADLIGRVRARMRSGVPVLIFPEGTTSPDETIRPFKTGGFAAVVDMPDAAVLPVYLAPISVNGEPIGGSNRRTVTWAGENEPFLSNLWRVLELRRIVMEVRFGEAFDVNHLGRKNLADEAHRRVEALRDGRAMEDTFAG
ncbi:MAG TPA: lysophospholipid acyltransferase family protein [Rhodothermales bacterium]|nr:lysophospholipid acyltransferase family protein [Rhodothermales bacterium]